MSRATRATATLETPLGDQRQHTNWVQFIVIVLFAISGATALIYEVSWARQIGELLGHTAQTAGVVLAVYFLGLAAGYEIGGRWSHRCRPLRAYALAEVVAALWTCLVPTLLRLVSEPSGLGVGGAGQVGWTLSTFLCLVILFPATAALGATLPLIAQYAARSGTGRSTSFAVAAYAANTLGAVVGVVAATGYMLVEIGVRSSSFVAAGAAVACALTALLVDSVEASKLRTAGGALLNPEVDSTISSRELPPHAEAQPMAAPASGPIVAAAASGFVVLAAEVLYTRLFALVFHNSTYSFGCVLAIFLTALSAGALATSLWNRWLPERSPTTGALWLTAILLPVSIVAFQRLTEFEYVRSGVGMWVYLGRCARLSGIVLIPPILAAGMVLPAAWIEAHHSGSRLGGVVGRLSTVNTLSAAVGALAVSLWLLPQLGLWMSFALLALMAGGATCFRLMTKRRLGLATGCVLSVGLSLFGGWRAVRPENTAESDSEVLRRWETTYGWIDVVRHRTSGSLAIRQNLHYRHGSTGDDVVREQRQAHLPLLLHEQPKDVLFLGLGTGVTAGGAVLHSEVVRIDVVELIPEVVEAAQMLASGNLEVLNDRRTHVTIDDARHFLIANERQYDVIVADLFVPWESGTGYLYTQEHFQRMRGRLKPGGVCCQWIALYQLGSDDFTTIADTFAATFSRTSVWWGYLSPRRPIVALMGSTSELVWNEQLLEQRLAKLAADPRFRDDVLQTPRGIADSVIGEWSIRRPNWLNTAEHPRVEFYSPWSQPDDRLVQNEILRQFFDDVLVHLPDCQWSAADQTPLAPRSPQAQRLATQRLVLFGEPAPAATPAQNHRQPRQPPAGIPPAG